MYDRYMTKNMEAAKDNCARCSRGRDEGLKEGGSLAQCSEDALADMPPRDESELDPVTLHNQALIVRDSDSSLPAVPVS